MRTRGYPVSDWPGHRRRERDRDRRSAWRAPSRRRPRQACSRLCAGCGPVPVAGGRSGTLRASPLGQRRTRAIARRVERRPVRPGAWLGSPCVSAACRAGGFSFCDLHARVRGPDEIGLERLPYFPLNLRRGLGDPRTHRHLASRYEQQPIWGGTPVHRRIVRALVSLPHLAIAPTRWRNALVGRGLDQRAESLSAYVFHRRHLEAPHTQGASHLFAFRVRQ